MKTEYKIAILAILAVLLFIFLKFGLNKEFKLTEIGIEKYVELNESPNKSVIYITTDTWESSKATTPIIKRVYEGSKRKVYVLNLDRLTDEEQLTFIKTNSLTSETLSYSTPMLIVIENKETLDSLIGVFNEDTLIDFILNNNIK